MDAVVQNVDSSGAVQVSVKPRAWLNQQEQSTKIRSSLPLGYQERVACWGALGLSGFRRSRVEVRLCSLTVIQEGFRVWGLGFGI